MLKTYILTLKAPIESRLDQTFEEKCADKLDDMPADNLLGIPAFKLDNPVIGIVVAIIRPDNINSFAHLIEYGFEKSRSVTGFQECVFDERCFFPKQLRLRISNVFS